MNEPKSPTLGNGKICYLEMPAMDTKVSADFYKKIFGWNIRQHQDGQSSFDDAVGEVSGRWVTGRNPTTEVGLLFYIMVDNAVSTMEAVIQHGGKIVQEIGADAPEITARFTDPAGNIIGLYQEPAKTT